MNCLTLLLKDMLSAAVEDSAATSSCPEYQETAGSPIKVMQLLAHFLVAQELAQYTIARASILQIPL